jgi:hypothetical protein
MDWEGLRERTLGEVANTLVAEGVGVGAGFIGASTIGRRIEDYMLPTGVDGTSWTSIFKGWTYNNVPKLAIWYVIRKYVPETPETRTQEMMMDAKKAIAGSVVFDTLLRTTNHGMPVHDPSGYKLLGGKGEPVRTAAPQADTQRLIQENSALRTELNKALQRLAAPTPAPQPVYVQAPAPQPVQTQAPQPVQPVQVQVQAPPVVQVQAPPARAPAPVVRYQPAPARPAPVVRVEQQQNPAQDRQQKFAFMPAQNAPPVVMVEQQLAPQAPAVSERQRKFAFMPTYHAPPAVKKREEKYGFAGKSSDKEIAAMFGML